MLVIVVAQHFLDELVEVGVMAEHDVSAIVPNKAVFVGVARGQSANMVISLEYFPVFVTEFGKPIGCTEPCGSRPYNYDLLAHVALPPNVPPYTALSRGQRPT